MELGLRLGDNAPPPFGKPPHPNVSHSALDFCLGFSTSLHQQIQPHKPNTFHQNDVVACFLDAPPPPPPDLQLQLLPRTPAAAAPRRSTSLTESGDATTAEGGELARNNPSLWSSLYGGGGAAAASDGGGILEVEEGNCDELEDENLGSKKKLRLSREQSAFLEESFKEHHTLYPKQKLDLARRLNLRPRQVEVWFQNRRARTKLKQTEVDCEYLKKCCESLTQQNRKLRKELQDLRALKTTDSLTFMHSPATTLTLCSSCERAAASGGPKHPATSKPSGFSFTTTGSFPFSPTDPSGENN